MASGDPYVVTLAALYGAGGTVIGPKVAERLGVRYLDRQIPEEVAKLASVPEEAVADVDEEPRNRSDRVLSALGRASTITGTTAVGSESLDVQESRIRSYIEEALARASTEGGVVLGRGGMVVLRDLPSALHVFLGGPREERIAKAMEIDRIDHETAAQRLGVEDITPTLPGRFEWLSSATDRAREQADERLQAVLGHLEKVGPGPRARSAVTIRLRPSLMRCGPSTPIIS